MKYLKIFEDFPNNFASVESKSRTKPLTDEEFLKIFNENCKNFSFMNDQLWRKSNREFGQLGLFLEKERRGTIGKYNYKTFFDLYPFYSNHVWT